MFRSIEEPTDTQSFVCIDDPCVPGLKDLRVRPSEMMISSIDIDKNVVEQFNVLDWLRERHNRKALIMYGCAGCVALLQSQSCREAPPT